MKLFAALKFGSREPTFLAFTEYWVYLPGTEMPTQEALTTYLLQTRRYATRAGNPIGPKEGLLFSDVRLHIALVLRARNAKAFRPDLFDSTAQPSREILQSLSETHSFVKVRYVSETRLRDDRHLRLLPHLADAVAELAGGQVVYDVVAERLMTRKDLQTLLSANPDAARADAHVRVVWIQGRDGMVAETRGLVKKGISEWRTVEMESDSRVLVDAVLEAAIRYAWSESEPPQTIPVTCFDDRYNVVLGKIRNGCREIRILRGSAG